MSNFIGCLKAGQQTEKAFICNLLMNNDITSIDFPQGKFKDYDVKVTYCNGDVKTYEIKRDLKAEETGNVAIEKRYKGDASGIYYSKADYIVYYTGSRWFIQKRGELILRLEKAEKKETRGGDGFKSDLILVKLSDMETLFNVLREDDNPKTL